jgi:hypothetical protein
MFNVRLVPEDYLFKGSLINASGKWMLITIGKIERVFFSKTTKGLEDPFGTCLLERPFRVQKT